MKLLRPNITSTGRWMRGAGGLVLASAALLAWPHSRMAALGLGAGGLFMLFEATCGWCAVRACGVKTRL